MVLVQIGNRVINLDLVTSIDLQCEAINWAAATGGARSGMGYVSAVILHFGAGEMAPQVELIGHEAEMFRAWVREHSADAGDARWKPIVVISAP